MRKITIQHAARAEPVIITWERSAAEDETLLVKVDGEPVEVALNRGERGSGVLHVHHRIFPYYATRDDDGLQLWIDGRTYAFTLPNNRNRRAQPAGGAALADLTAPMPGTVRAVRVAAGDVFAAHDPLVVLESMKMEMTLSAPKPGKVLAVLCAEDDMVEMGATLLKLTDREQDAE